MRKTLIYTLALGLGFFLSGIARAGDECQAEQADSTLVGRIEQVEAAAQKGCETSKAKLVSLQQASGTTDMAKVKEQAAALSEQAAAGDEVARAKLARLQAALAAQPAKKPLSVRLARCQEKGDKGCKNSGKIMAALLKDSGAKTPAALIEKVSQLEAAAKTGDKEAQAQLKRFEAVVFNNKPLAKRVAMFARMAKQGCKTSKAKLAAVMAACSDKSGKECGEDGGMECGDKGGMDCGKMQGAKATDPVARIEQMEAKAAKGCKNCVAKLAELDGKLVMALEPATAAAAPAKAKKKDCCGAGGGGGGGCPDKPKDKPKGECPGS